MASLFLRRPSIQTISRFLETQASQPLSYPATGATAKTPPPDHDVDHTRVRLGEGEAVFHAACRALERWTQFRLGWVDVWSPETPIEPGRVVAVLGRAIGLWWLNACRIVYTIRETEPFHRFGFAYGTLPGHVESGEERFLVEWNPMDGSVWYDILAFSRPNHILTRLGYPVVRRVQKRFGRDSAAAMLAEVTRMRNHSAVDSHHSDLAGQTT